MPRPSLMLEHPELAHIHILTSRMYNGGKISIFPNDHSHPNGRKRHEHKYMDGNVAIGYTRNYK